MYQNNRKSKILTALLVLLLITAMLGGCDDKEDSDNTDAGNLEVNEIASDIKVSLSIDFPDGKGPADVDDVSIQLPSDQSVLDLLNVYANENNLDVVIEGDDTPYVVSIGGVSQNDKEGWTYTVNDEMVMVSAGEAILNNGDEVEWEFDTFD